MDYSTAKCYSSDQDFAPLSRRSPTPHSNQLSYLPTPQAQYGNCVCGRGSHGDECVWVYGECVYIVVKV